MTTQTYMTILKKLSKRTSFPLGTLHIDTIKKIVDTMQESGRLLIEAPTGWGKTYASIIAIIIHKLIAQDKRPIIYTSKTHNVLVKTFNLYKILNSEITNKELRSVLFIGKEKLCPFFITQQPEQEDFIYGLCEYMRYNSMCDYYINYLSRFGEGVEFLMKNWKRLDDIVGEEELTEMDTCLYYIIKSNLRSFDLVITSYFNVFSNIRDYLLEATSYEMPILIIDEIHNLPRYYFNLLTYKISINELRAFDELYIMFSKLAYKANEKGLKLANYIDLETIYSSKTLLDDKIRKFFDWEKEKHLISTLYKTRLFLNYALMKYENVFLYYDKHNNIIYLVPKKDLSRLPEILNNYYSVIGFSATLSPIHLYIDMLFGGYNNRVNTIIIKDYPRYLPRPNITILYEYTSRYKDRTISMLENIAKKIFEITIREGSSAVYSASYELSKYLEKELIRLKNKSIQRTIPVEILNILDPLDTLRLYENIKHNDNRRVILLTSQRGRLSEGVDLPTKFRNIIICGLSIPPSNLEDYLYTKYMLRRPAYKKVPTEAQIQSAAISVIQSIGRVLRRDRSTVNIYIFDWRFTWKRFREYIPKWFSNLMKRN